MVLFLKLQRLLQLGWRRQAILAEALAAITGASAATKLLPFGLAIRSGSRAPSAGDRAQAEVTAVCWGVTRAAAVVPWRAVCLQQGLAAQAMLRRRGFDAVLHYGVGKGDAGNLTAHVWVSVNGQTVTGGEAQGEYAEVARYPMQAHPS